MTDLCDMGYYQFVFDGGRKRYLIMAGFTCTDDGESDGFAVFNGYGQALPIGCKNMKSETFTVCDLERCSEEDIQEAKGKTFYMAARNINSLAYYPKQGDYVGAQDWNYPQLHNPFTQAMRSLYDGPLEQAESSPDDYEIIWKDPVLEELVRQELAELWQFTKTEWEAFQKRPLTTADLAAVENLSLRAKDDKVVYLQLNDDQDIGGIFLFEKLGSAAALDTLTTLDDLVHFKNLRSLNIQLEGLELTDFSAIGELTGLRELCLDLGEMQARLRNADLAFLKKLPHLRLLYLYGRDDTDNGYSNSTPARFFEEITDLSVLKNCPHLAYLKLSTGNVENYDFLKELPELYYVELEGREEMKNAEPDVSLIPNACFVYYYGNDVVFDVGGEQRN